VQIHPINLVFLAFHLAWQLLIVGSHSSLPDYPHHEY